MEKYDLVIIGGGIIGMMCAFAAKFEHPEWSVTILDKSLIGSQTTSKSAFLDMPYGTSKYKRELTSRSRQLFKEVIYPKLGNLELVTTDFIGFSEEESIEEVRNGIVEEVDVVDVSILMEELPSWINLANDQTALTGAKADFLLSAPTDSLRSFLLENNVTFKEGLEINGVKKVNADFVITPKIFEPFCAKRVIEATGPVMGLNSLLEGSSPIEARIKKVIAFHVDVLPKPDDRSLYFFDDDAFLIPHFRSKRWLFSYRCEDWDIEFKPSQINIEKKNLNRARAVLNKYAPAIIDKISGGRVFCDLYRESGDPLVESLTNNYVRVGAPGGSGYRLSPALAFEAITKLNNIQK